MQALFIRNYGDATALEFGERPEPEIGPDDLLVAVLAASVNPIDFKIRDGKVRHLVPATLPLVLGSDLCGRVLRVGDAVTAFKPGDVVYARLDKRRIGSFAERAAVRASDAALKPRNLSAVQAASLPLAALTAWQALVDIGGLQVGQRVLIHNGSGGVGTLAIQIAKHLGAQVATTVGARNRELALKLGADRVIDYKHEAFDQVLKDCDLVFDMQGGDTLLRSFSVVRRGGTVVSVGGVPSVAVARAMGAKLPIRLALALMNRRINARARAVGARYEYLFMSPSGAQLAQLAALFDSGTLEPVIDRTYPLREAAQALAYVEAGHATGKVVVEVASAND